MLGIRKPGHSGNVVSSDASSRVEVSGLQPCKCLNARWNGDVRLVFGATFSDTGPGATVALRCQAMHLVSYTALESAPQWRSIKVEVGTTAALEFKAHDERAVGARL